MIGWHTFMKRVSIKHGDIFMHSVFIFTIYSIFNIKELLGSGYDSAGYSVNLKGLTECLF